MIIETFKGIKIIPTPKRDSLLEIKVAFLEDEAHKGVMTTTLISGQSYVIKPPKKWYQFIYSINIK